MNHQDWKEVVLHKPNSKKKQQTEKVKRTHNINVREVDIAEGKTIQYISNALKNKMTSARNNTIHPQTERPISRDEFARKLNVPVKNIQLIETGKITEKEAKQIALKIERIYKIKIL